MLLLDNRPHNIGEISHNFSIWFTVVRRFVSNTKDCRYPAITDDGYDQFAFYRLTRRLKLDFDLYVITDPMRDHVKTARAVIAGGARIVQLRDKSASKKQILKWAKKIRKIAKGTGAIFIVNDYPEIAEAVDADGVHLGQGDLSKMPIKRIRASARCVGVL